MALISFTGQTKDSWDRGVLDHRLKTVLRDVAMEFGGIWLTCLDRSKVENTDAGGVKNSKHLLDPVTGKCSAADFVLMNEALNSGVEDYLAKHFTGLFVLYHDVKSGLHFHVHINSEIKLLA